MNKKVKRNIEYLDCKQESKQQTIEITLGINQLNADDLRVSVLHYGPTRV